MIIQMRAICMCFSVLQQPKCRARYFLKRRSRSFAGIWCEQFSSLCTVGSNHILKPLGSNGNRQSKEGHEPVRSRKLTTITKLDSINDKSQSSKQYIIKPNEILDEIVKVDTQLNINRSKVGTSDGIKYCEVQQKIEQNLQQHVTILVFDLETTGLSREHERVIEIAMRDLRGGKDSTFQTLINPERYVPNSHVHGITTHMVNNPNVPRFKDFIPILKQYVQSRHVSSAPVLWVAHNARCFDVPFLASEFSRCSEVIPSHWRFLDSIALARELEKELEKLDASKNLSGKSIQALREFYGIPLVGNPHRAMSDVHTLSMILQAMTVDLKLPLSSLLERSFTVLDLINSQNKKKKKKKSAGSNAFP